jgi:hypothetical protein
MLSFKQFIIERKNPIAVAQRTAKIYGKKEKYGKWLTVEKGNHIPLRSYRSKEADSIFNRFDKKFPPDKKTGRKEMTGAGAKEHEIKHLTATQPFVRTGDVEQLRSKVSEMSPTNISTASYKGKTYILDGHHAVMAAALRGEKTITANNHYELD